MVENKVSNQEQPQIIQSTPQVAQETQPPTQSPLSFKPVYLLLIIIFLLLIGGGAYYVNNQSKIVISTPQPTSTSQPTPVDETANWKTYTNQRVGFSIKYPINWDVKSIDEADATINTTYFGDPTIKSFTNNMLPLVTLVVKLDPNNEIKKIEEVPETESMSDVVGSFQTKDIVWRKITVDNINAVRTTHIYCQSGQCEAVIFKKGELVFGLTMNQGEPDLQIFNSMLATFTFLDQEQSSATFDTQELNGFPVYPNTIFVNKEKQPSCGKEVSGFSTCGTTLYSWTTTNDYDTVNTWYTNNAPKSGWNKGGSAGSYVGPRDASGQDSYKKGGLIYKLLINANSKETQIQLGIRY